MQTPQSDSDSHNVYQLDEALLRTTHARIAANYTQSSALPEEVSSRLFEHLAPVRIIPQRIVDLGSGTGRDMHKLRRIYRNARVIGIDISAEMLGQAHRNSRWWNRSKHLLCADLNQIPLQNQSIDLVYSNLSLLWCRDLDSALHSIAQVQAPNGLLAFSTLGPDSLRELRDSWQAVDAKPHVHAFYDMHDIGDALVRARYTDVVMDVERLTVNYRDLPALLGELKNLGGASMLASRRRTLTGKARLENLTAAYETLRTEEGLPVTLEVIYAHAWRPQPRSQSVSLSTPKERSQDRSSTV